MFPPGGSSQSGLIGIGGGARGDQQMQNITGHRDYDHVPPAGPPRVSLDQRCLTKLTIGASVNLNGAGTYESEPIVEDRDPQQGLGNDTPR